MITLFALGISLKWV